MGGDQAGSSQICPRRSRVGRQPLSHLDTPRVVGSRQIKVHPGTVPIRSRAVPTIVPRAAIPGVVVVEPEVHRDQRGSFSEIFRAEWFPGRPPMVQANRATRNAGTVVGLHVHRRQSDYWTVVAGQARVVLHDLRPGPAGGATVCLDLGGPDGPTPHRGLYVPAGVAHGFAAITDVVLTYQVDANYDPNDELGVAWDDPAIAAEWGIDGPVLSDRDRALPKLAELPESWWPIGDQQ